VEAEVEETHQSIVATEPMAAAEDTAVLQIGDTVTTHTVKILVEDGVLLMPILPIPVQVVVLAHTGLQTLVGMLEADMAPAV
jgi:hypothetical protein